MRLFGTNYCFQIFITDSLLLLASGLVNISTAKQTRTIIEDLLDVLLSMLSMSYERKTGNSSKELLFVLWYLFSFILHSQPTTIKLMQITSLGQEKLLSKRKIVFHIEKFNIICVVTF
jgi:hypothetical protein